MDGATIGATTAVLPSGVDAPYSGKRIKEKRFPPGTNGVPDVIRGAGAALSVIRALEDLKTLGKDLFDIMVCLRVDKVGAITRTHIFLDTAVREIRTEKRYALHAAISPPLYTLAERRRRM